MCGRYEFDDRKDVEEIHKIMKELNNGISIAYKTGEIFPSYDVPVLSVKSNKPNLSVMMWGFPKWDKKGLIINAKSETALEKKMFSKPLIEKRCVILSTGFFEWQKIDLSKKKDKYLFTLKDSPMLYMAGLYNTFEIEGNIKDCFVILTRNANSYISDIHNRMPVILYRSELKNWLFDKNYIDVVFKRDDVALNRKFLPKGAVL